ncbi:hypothetical protein [Parasediminibacterium sp. JCM 36343]|uniref:hypothetical protein n=1 Tax=Parasediminibacterium sp. JCM 36343 TaxID=3374279 RepID=UPI00397C3AAC
MNGILGLHSLLRWAMVIFLIVNIVRVNVEADQHFDELDKKWSLRLLITTHLNLVAALILYFFGENGIQIVIREKYQMKDVMETGWLRFWIIEHPLMMLICIALITVSHSFSKKMDLAPAKKHRIMSILYILALVIILAAAPWPFRDVSIARPWFRGLY